MCAHGHERTTTSYCCTLIGHSTNARARESGAPVTQLQSSVSVDCYFYSITRVQFSTVASDKYPVAVPITSLFGT